MRDSDAVLLLRDSDLGTSNHGAGERGAEEVHIFVDGVALGGGEAELLDELLAEILDIDFLGPDFHSLLLGGFEVSFLTDVCHKADDAVALPFSLSHARMQLVSRPPL